MNSHLGELRRGTPQCVTLLVDLVYQECSEGPAYDEASAVLPIEFLKRGENGFAEQPHLWSSTAPIYAKAIDHA